MTATAQCMEALARANAARAGRSGIKRALAAAELSLPAALADERAQGMRVQDLLGAQYGWGPERVERALSATQEVLSPAATNHVYLAQLRVRDLTDRQRAVLLRVCAAAGERG